jgi:hypothetical protein
MALGHLKRPCQPATIQAAKTVDPMPAASRPPGADRVSNHDDLLTPAMAGDRLKVTAKVLERWRGTGEGPSFVRLTSKTIRYRVEDIEDFITGRTRASTASA